ncbi:MAG: SDR family oxidoreductase [Alphaproteobacteria bacterium]
MKIGSLFKVEGLVTVVTGGASGIGHALGEAMATNGARVTLLDNNKAALTAAAEDLTSRVKAIGPTLTRNVPQAEHSGLSHQQGRGDDRSVFGAVVDVTDKASLARTFNAIAEREGRIDVVFANAGISGGPGFLGTDGQREPSRAIENISDDLWDRVIETNLSSIFKTIQVAVPHLKRAGGGRIIVTSSISAIKTENYVGAAYVASKAGVAQLVRQAAIELAAYNIQVNAIAPGPCITNIGGGRLHERAAQEFFARLHPNHRMATPEDMQGAALYLASPASRHVNGASIVIDGGFSLGIAD